MRNQQRAGKVACAALLALGLTACQSSGDEDSELTGLPYHVALAPASAEIFEDQRSVSEEAEGLLVDLKHYTSPAAGEERVNLPKVLGRQLQKDLFSKVTVLDGESEQSEAQLVAAAKASGADLLMTIEQIVYDSESESRARPSNWVWWLTGPFVFLFTDRSYRLDGTIEVALYDVNKLADPGELDPDYVLDPTALVRRFRAKPDWIDTKYTDRAEGGMDYVKSIVVPTSYLRSDGQGVSRIVATESIRSMARSLASDIAVDADFVVRPSQRQTQFYWAEGDGEDLGRPRIVGEGPDTRLAFETEILQRSGSAERAFQTAEVRVGDQVFELGQGAPGPGGSIERVEGRAPEDWVRKRIKASIPIEAAASTLASQKSFQLTLNDSRDARSMRTWTFPVGSDNVRAIEAASHERGATTEALMRSKDSEQ